MAARDLPSFLPTHTQAKAKGEAIQLRGVDLNSDDYPYKEVQIHGPVILAEHVKQLVAHQSHRKETAIVRLLKSFRKAHKVPVVWMDTLEELEE